MYFFIQTCPDIPTKAADQSRTMQMVDIVSYEGSEPEEFGKCFWDSVTGVEVAAKVIKKSMARPSSLGHENKLYKRFDGEDLVGIPNIL